MSSLLALLNGLQTSFRKGATRLLNTSCSLPPRRNTTNHTQEISLSSIFQKYPTLPVTMAWTKSASKARGTSKQRTMSSEEPWMSKSGSTTSWLRGSTIWRKKIVISGSIHQTKMRVRGRWSKTSKFHPQSWGSWSSLKMKTTCCDRTRSSCYKKNNKPSTDPYYRNPCYLIHLIHT